MAYEPYVFPSVFTDREVLEFTKMSDAIANPRIAAGDIVPGGVGISALATGAVTNSKIADGAVTKDKIAPNSISNRTLMDRGVFTENIALWAVGNDRLATGAVDARVADFDSVEVNRGELYPLQSFKFSSSIPDVGSKTRNTILEAKVIGAEPGYVYQIDSIRRGLSGNIGLRVSRWKAPKNGVLFPSGRSLVFDNMNEDVLVIQGGTESPDTETIISSGNGVTVSVTYDINAIGSVLNIAENDLGEAQAAVIHPINYSYSEVIKPDGEHGKTVYVDKKETEMTVLVPSVFGYVGFGLKRKTVPYTDGGHSGMNMDLWSIDRISGFTKEGDEFIERSSRVFVYSPSDTNPTTTQDTIFRRVEDDDYSGGNYHGDEKIQYYRLIIGNSDNLTDSVGLYSGESVELVQETLLYEDSVAAGTGDTDPFVKVNKVHRFDADNVYTLYTRVESLKDSNLEMSSIGAFQMRRAPETGSYPNFTGALGLNTAKHVNIRKPDSGGNHYQGDGEKRYKFFGWYKQVDITFESDSDYFDTWTRNYANHDTKMYSRIVPKNGLFAKGEVITSSVNYNFKIMG